MTKNIMVVKSNGKKEIFDLEKVHKVLMWAIKGITGVSISDIEMKSSFDIVDGITTKDIHDSLISAAANLITEETPNYQYVAARLALFKLRKDVYGQFEPKPLLEHIESCVSNKSYSDDLLKVYTKEDIEYLNSKIDHNRDYNLTYAAIKEFITKYLVQNRKTKTVYESPQMCYMIQAMATYSELDISKEERLKLIVDDYDTVSLFKISLPTPIMAGLRTPVKQYSSCVLIECDDTVDSIAATGSAINKYVAKKAGIGVNLGRLRAEGAEIRGGDTYHTGITPIARKMQADVKSFSQGGVRGGAATAFFPLWHLEIEQILSLKNEKGTEDNRVRRLDYGIHFNTFLHKRLLAGQNISLFSPNEVPDLYNAFFENQEEFERLYLKYESMGVNNELKQYKSIPASELYTHWQTERAETGRYYWTNIDHINVYGKFKPEVAPVRQSNLCLEITLPTRPLQFDRDPDGWIALCTLSAVNMGEVKDLSDLEEICAVAVRKLDTLLDYQDYPVLAAENHTKQFRPLGVGVSNYAYWLAKNGLTYDETKENFQESLDKTHEFFEAFQYYLIKASIQLAKERGKCEGYEMTKWSEGILPVDLYKKEVDQLAKPKYNLDWDSLREDLKKYGIRNATLSALMPAETSAKITNSTNGIEPIRNLVAMKGGKESLSANVAPEIRKLKNKYDLLWDLPSPKGYIRLCGVIQKFICQSISANTSYNPYQEQYNATNNKVPVSLMLQHQLEATKYGIRTGYYNNTYDGNEDDEDQDNDCVDGGCKI